MIDISTSYDISILHLYGEISLLEADLIEKMIESFKRHKHFKILLDLAQCDYVHFQAVKKWAEQAKQLQSVNGDLKLAQVGRDTKNIIKFIGADQYLRDYSSASDALLSFLKSAADKADYEVLLGCRGKQQELADQKRKKLKEARFH